MVSVLTAFVGFLLGILVASLVMMRMAPWWSLENRLLQALRQRLWEKELTDRRVRSAEEWARKTREKNRRLRHANRELRKQLRRR